LSIVVGNQVPVIPSIDAIGKTAEVSPTQIGANVVNVGVTLGFTVIL
jgi:hypothetical protein